MGLKKASCRKGLVLGLALILPWAGGCGADIGQRSAEAQQTFDQMSAHLRQLGSLYNDYALKQGRPPTQAADLQAWAKKLRKTDLEKMGIEDLEKAFVSPRDKQPYVIRPAGMRGRKGSGGQPEGAVMVHERTGADGKRFVLLVRGNVVEMGEEQFRHMTSPAP
jgi:hypothetical protein